MILDKMNEGELREYLDFVLWHYRVIDSFWYIFTEEELGTPAADHFNERVWEKSAEIAARGIKKRFGLVEKGLGGFRAAQQYFPWSILVGYEFEEKPGELIMRVPSCPTQLSRLKRGLPEYACKEMHRRELTGFAKEIDPAIRIECVHAPTDPHPPETFCTWRFTMAE